jgi:hypothetical protein
MLYNVVRLAEVTDTELIETSLDDMADQNDGYDDERQVYADRAKRMLRVLYSSETTKIGSP